jgi:hypothetical protein
MIKQVLGTLPLPTATHQAVPTSTCECGCVCACGDERTAGQTGNTTAQNIGIGNKGGS